MALDNTRSQVAHLLRRAGFGATEAELDQYTALGFAGAVGNCAAAIRTRTIHRRDHRGIQEEVTMFEHIKGVL